MPTCNLISLFIQINPSSVIRASFLSYKVGINDAENVLRIEEELSMEEVPPTIVPFKVSSIVSPSSFNTSIFNKKCCGFWSISFKSFAVIICSTIFLQYQTGLYSINPSRNYNRQFLPTQKICSYSDMWYLPYLLGRQ